jgi:hypothetical protein
MSPEELVAIRRRVAKTEHPQTSAERDRAALMAEIDRLRDLWEECRRHCFDPSEVKEPFRPV